MNPENYEALRKLLCENAVHLRSHLRPDKVRCAAGMEWLDLSPRCDDSVPKGQLWIME